MRRPMMQRREEQTGQHDDQAAEPDDDAVDPRLDLGEAQQHSLFQGLQVLLGDNVVVDRVEDLGGDPLGLLAIDIGLRQRIGQRKPVGQRAPPLSAPHSTRNLTRGEVLRRKAGGGPPCRAADPIRRASLFNTTRWAASCEAALLGRGTERYSAAARTGVLPSTSAAASATGVPSKKSGFCVPKSRTALAKVKSRKSSRVISSSSTNSQASGRTMRMSGISKWPTSELKIALIRAPSGLSLLNATAFMRSSGSQPTN